MAIRAVNFDVKLEDTIVFGYDDNPDDIPALTSENDLRRMFEAVETRPSKGVTFGTPIIRRIPWET